MNKGQLIAIGIIAALLVGSSIFYYLKSIASATRGNVKKSTGSVFYTLVGGKYAIRHVVISESNLSFPWPYAESLLKKDTRYHFYYLDTTMTILSVEEA